MGTIVPLIITAVIRFLWNFSFFFIHPLFAHFGSQFADTIDNNAWRMYDPSDRHFYDIWDKSADMSAYIFWLFHHIYYFNVLWYVKWTLPFLVYRIIGNTAFIITVNHILIPIFPDVFSVLFIVLAGLDYIGLSMWLRRKVWLQFVLVIVCTGTVVFAEIVRYIKINNGGIPAEEPWIDFRQFLFWLIVMLILFIGLGCTKMPAFDRFTVTRSVYGHYEKTGIRSQFYNAHTDPVWILGHFFFAFL